MTKSISPIIIIMQFDKHLIILYQKIIFLLIKSNKSHLILIFRILLVHLDVIFFFLKYCLLVKQLFRPDQFFICFATLCFNIEDLSCFELFMEFV